MKINLITAAVLMSALLIGSCKKEELNIVAPIDLGGETWPKTAVDQWISDSLTTPYNITVKYRWTASELNHLDKTLTPPDESMIIPALSAIKRVWIEPFNAETGSDLFIKKYSAKQFILIGSAEYDVDGTVTLGQAEGGNSIVFFDINQNFIENKNASLKFMLHAAHHEFAHILHQNVIFPQEFRGVSNRLGLTGYTATWFNVSENEAHNNGYVTSYAMAEANEDFAEMASQMLTQGKNRFDELVASVNPVAQQALRTKEQYIVDYFRETWNIDYYSLQTRVQAALNVVAPVGLPPDAFGWDKEYTIASVDPSNQTLLPQRPAFMSLFNSSAAAVQQIPDLGLTLDSLAFISTADTSMLLRMFIGQAGQAFAADFVYRLDANGNVYDLTFVSENGNAAEIHDEVMPLLDYFENNQFTLTWYAPPTLSIYPRVKFATVSSPTNYFLALLIP